MWIGLTGRNGSGKGEVAAYLGKHGFRYHSLSDVIRDEVRSRGKELDRETLIETGNELRRRFGAGVLAQRVVQRIDRDHHAVIDSIRNPDEVAALRSGGHFRLLHVRADPRTRFERVRARGRPGDAEDYATFLEQEDRELAGNEHSQNLEAVEAMADRSVDNDGGLEDLHRSMDHLLLELLREVPRPGWDQYFMDIARVTAARSNCLKRKVAAVIVRDRRVISTGYNGTPRGTRNCNEGGCPRCNQLAASGTGLGECLCSHGEENAIVQAAYHGVQLTGSTIYTTYAPCLLCAKMIINSGIAEVVYNEEYPLNDRAFGLFKEAGVTVRRLQVG